MSEQERVCVPMCGEMVIRQVEAWDHQQDRILGPHKHLQQFLAAGIYCRWEVPDMFQFDTNTMIKYHETNTMLKYHDDGHPLTTNILLG